MQGDIPDKPLDLIEELLLTQDPDNKSRSDAIKVGLFLSLCV